MEQLYFWNAGLVLLVPHCSKPQITFRVGLARFADSQDIRG